LAGALVRAARDEPGRHDGSYYRTRESVQPDSPPSAPRKVTIDRGARSFGANFGRRRAL
jgi:hypothetical protein